MGRLKSLRQQATSGQPPATESGTQATPDRPVVRVERVTEENPQQPPVAALPAPAAAEAEEQRSTASESAVTPAKEDEASPSPPAAQVTASLDFNTLLQAAQEGTDDEEEDEGDKITLYLSAAQSERLSALCGQLQTALSSSKPVNAQQVFRYLLDTLSDEAFNGFVEYERNRRVQRFIASQQRRFQRELRRAQRKFGKITGA